MPRRAGARTASCRRSRSGYPKPRKTGCASSGAEVYTGRRVTRVTADGVLTHDGQSFPAALKVWAAGIKTPEFLHEIAGLETNRLNQLVVRPTLRRRQRPRPHTSRRR